MKNYNFYISFAILLIMQTSCKDTEIKHVGSCYIIDNNQVKYLERTDIGNLDTITLKEANDEFFKIIYDEIPGNECFNGSIWGKDKLNVWYKSSRIEGADPSSFKLLDNSYAVDKSHAYYGNSGLIGASANTFNSLGYFFAKDDKLIWHKGKEVFGVADVKSFDVYDSYFSKDSGQIYFNNDTLLMPIPDSDPVSFKCFEKAEKHELNSIKYYIDDNKVYSIDTDKSINDPDFILIFEAFTASFRALPVKYFTQDDFNVYYKNKVIENVDRKTFMTFEKDYSKDNKSVYYMNKKIFGADPKTFTVETDETPDYDARDDKSIYLNGKKIEKIN